MQQAAVPGHVAADEGIGALGQLEPLGLLEGIRRMGESDDRKPIPIGKHLVVPARRHASLARGKELGLHADQPLLGFGVLQLQLLQPVRDAVAFEVAGLSDVVEPAEQGAVGLAQHGLHLIGRPDGELALLAFGVRIIGGRQAALRCLHLSGEPRNRLLDPLREQRLLRLPPGLHQELDQQGIVVEHLLEVGYQPAFVDRIAREAASDVVVDAALADVSQRGQHGNASGRQVEAHGASPQQPEEAELRELGRSLQAAMHRVHHLCHAERQVLEGGFRDLGPLQWRALSIQPLENRLCILRCPVRLRGMDAGDLGQHALEGRPAVAVVRREIGAAPEGFRAGRQEHGERPATLLAKRMKRAHVDGIDIRPLFAVDFDVHIEVVHEAGCRLVLEAFMGHDMAPVAGRIAYGEQDRLARPLRLCQRLGPPRPPVDGIVLVLDQVWARFGGEAVVGHAVLLRALAGAVSRMAAGTRSEVLLVQRS